MGFTQSYKDLHEIYSQSGDIIRARTALRKSFRDITSVNAKLEALVAGGNFDQIPDDIKTVLVRWKDLNNQLEDAIRNDKDIMDLFNFNPALPIEEEPKE